MTEPAPTRVTSTTVPDHPLPTTTSSAAVSPAASPGLAADLLDAVAAFTRIDDPTVDRSLDILDAAAIQPDPSEEFPLLETRGFQGGWTRAFRSDTRDVVVATVYEFASPVAAAFYLEDGLITIGGYGGQFFDVPDIEGGRGFVQEFDDDGEPVVSVGVTFVREQRWFLLYLVGHPDTARPDIVLTAAREQAERVATGR